MSKGTLKFTAKVVAMSPLQIGSGNSDRSDSDVLLDEASGKPFIPATSFVGVMRNLISRTEAGDDQQFKTFFGDSQADIITASNLMCSDLHLTAGSKPTIVKRDSVRIDTKTGMAEDKKKFDFEVVEPGADFNLKMLCNYKNSEEKYFAIKVFSSLVRLIENNQMRLGKKTTGGLGLIKIKDAQIEDYDLEDKDGILAWLKNNAGKEIEFSEEVYQLSDNVFEVDAWFDLKTSLIIRSYPGDAISPDSSSMKSAGRSIIPGTSLRGAIRTRAERILNTIPEKPDTTDNILHKLFGNVDDKNRMNKATMSKVRIEECVLDGDKFIELIQSRLKIDRFTGGALSSALFDSMPLFRKDKASKEKVINIKMTLQDPDNYEKGLLLLILKDLWTGDLALGGEKNVGRGVIQGVCCKISAGDGMQYEFNDPKDLEEDARRTLQSFVTVLNSKGAAA